MTCCRPETTQIFNSAAAPGTNSYRFRVPGGQEGQLTATGLQPGDFVTVLTQDPNDPTVWVPMTIGGAPVILTADNPSVDLPPGLYRVVPSASVADNAPPVIVSGFTYRDVGLTSVAAYYGTPTSYEEVEIVRVSEFGDPRLYRAGTDVEIEGFDPALIFYSDPETPSQGEQTYITGATLTTDNTVDVPSYGYVVVQNRTGAVSFYTFGDGVIFEIADRQTVTFSGQPAVTLGVPPGFVEDENNPGLVYAVFAPS